MSRSSRPQRHTTRRRRAAIELFARDPMTTAFTFAFPLVLIVLAGMPGNAPEVDGDAEVAFRHTGLRRHDREPAFAPDQVRAMRRHWRIPTAPTIRYRAPDTTRIDASHHIR